MCVERMKPDTRTEALVFDEEIAAHVFLLPILSKSPVKDGIERRRHSSDDTFTGSRPHQTVISELGDE